jgi:ribonuclease R
MKQRKKNLHSTHQPHKKSARATGQHKQRHEPIAKQITGTLAVTAGGLGFVTSPDLPLDIRIDDGALGGAFDGDTVSVTYRKSGTRLSGRITGIITRGRTEFVGTIEVDRGSHFLVPDDRRFHADILLPHEAVGNAQIGDKAVVRIERWGDAHESPVGAVTRVIGRAGDKDTEMISIALSKGFDNLYPKDATEEAERLAESERTIKPDELSLRRDFRDIPTFTIDPADAKDFDDAISFQKLPDGMFEIGVHIADVSHYVRPGTALDHEASKRATSVYLADRTIPMLPFVLSDDLCSLTPGSDKRTFSAVFTMDEHGAVHKRWFGKTLIRSIRRFSYEDAQASITTGTGDYAKELATLNSIAKKLATAKRSAGAIDFDLPESKIELNADGSVKRIYRKERLDAHRLVEEFMLLANREVAEVVFRAHEKREGEVFLYRVHDLPDPERLADLSFFLKAMGHTLALDKNGSATPKALQTALSGIAGTPEEAAVRTATLRAMAKAIYSTKNIGHFGLAFRFYTHFTSPIRRYPDLMVHRSLARHLDKVATQPEERASYERMARHSTDREIAAAEAERATIKRFQAIHMATRLLEEFDGVVTGVAEWGVFVEEIATGCEGLIRLPDLPNDEWRHDAKNFRLVGSRTGMVLRIGDKVRAKILSANPDSRTVDLALVV